MTTVTLDVRSLKESLRDVAAVVKSGNAAKSARISFASVELLWEVLTAKRWDILKAMAGAGPLTYREIAERVGRDVKAVHTDVRALLVAGIVRQANDGVVFPYEAIHVDFTLNAVA